MKVWKLFLLLCCAVVVAIGLYGMRLIWRGFSTADEPSYLERVAARAARNFAIPRKARLEVNPWKPTPDVLKAAREIFIDRCAVCHGPDGSGQTGVGRNLYPKVPALRLPQTQSLTDGEIRYIIRNGVRLTGMPGWAKPHDEQSDDSWKLVLFVRSLAQLSKKEQEQEAATRVTAHYAGSQACQKCHEKIYEHWRKTPMANVVRDPRQFPDAIIPDLSTNTVAKFTKDQVPSGVWQPLEAALLHQNRGRLLSGTGTVGHHQSRLASVFCGKWNRLVGPSVSSRQYATAHGPDMRWVPFGGLQHPYQASGGVERWMRKVPRPWQ